MQPIQEHGYIYAIGYDGEVKVGKTAFDPRKRLTQMQSGNCRYLELIAATYVQDYHTAEKALHKRLKQENKWIRGEWFRLTPEEARALVESVGEDMIAAFKQANMQQMERTMDTLRNRGRGLS